MITAIKKMQEMMSGLKIYVSVFLCSVIIFLCSGTPVFSQTKTTTNSLTGGINTITTAVPFLLIAPDARAGAMGDAGVASSPDAASIHWNAAKLGFADKNIGCLVSYTPWLHALVPDISLAYISMYKRMKKDQTLAASLRYFSLGNITFTDIGGYEIGQFTPHEFALDVAYARRLSDRFSGGMAMRYINSNLTGGYYVDGNASHPGQSVAVDISTYYRNEEIEVAKHKSVLGFGLNISNIGAKIAYTQTGNRDFIPINMRLGGSLKMALDEYNEIAFLADLTKLLVPTPPVYVTDSLGNKTILAGKDPAVGITQGMLQSFYDAPGGGKEELKEVNVSIGTEYWYDKQFAIRAGYFYEDPTKGNRKFFTLGAGLKYNVFSIDFAYLIPTQQKNPLENTLRFSLLFDFDAFKSQNKTEAQ